MTNGSTVVFLLLGKVVLHVVLFNPFSSAESAVVMDGGLLGWKRGKHEDILNRRNMLRVFFFLVTVILGFKVAAWWVG